jgi:murein DD-endopeptidase MepM/ murein hydrolase activator NlpD
MRAAEKLKTTKLDIFPMLEDGATAGFLNLNDCAVKARYQPTISQFLTPSLTDRLLDFAHKKLGIRYSLGGYLEDRRDLWRGSYMQPEEAVHLGIDINMPAGTPVCITRPATVVRTVHDPEQNGGWGGVIMFELDQPIGTISHFLYAHLSKQGIQVKVGDKIAPKAVVGYIGQSHENGGWYEHTHVQAFTAEAWALFKGELKNFDGYTRDPDAAVHPYFPNPMPLLNLA